MLPPLNINSQSDITPATAARLNQPTGAAVGADGSLYIVDMQNNLIRCVAPDQIIQTVAGKFNLSGYNGDGQLATQASLSLNPGPAQAFSAVAVGADGSLYIADAGNNLVRRVAPDGFITTVAGNVADCNTTPCTAGYSGDNNLATKAQLSDPASIAVDRYGFLYIEDIGNNRIRRVAPDGIITNFAGNGATGAPWVSGDGGPATDAEIQLASGGGITVAPDGAVFFADIGNSRIRRIAPDGIITTVAGGGGSPVIDGSSATDGALGTARGIALGPDGGLFLTDAVANSVRKVSVPFPGYQPFDFDVPSKDGNEVYVFSGDGLHERTLNALTGATLFTFSYDSNGRLQKVTDGDQNTTTINYDTSGNPKTIVGPFGQTTTLGVDAHGYLNSVSDPLTNTYNMVYKPDGLGLLSTFTDPNGNVSGNASKIVYDDTSGRLKIDTDAAGGSKQLTRTDSALSYSVNVVTGLGRQTNYTIENQPTGNERRVNLFPDGTKTELLIGTDGSRQTTTADGTVSNLLQGPDPRFSMASPLPTNVTTTTGGLTSVVNMDRVVVPPSPAPPTSITSLTDTTNINNRSFIRKFDASLSTFTSTSAAGRTNTVTTDAQGRVIAAQITGLDNVTLSYPGGQLSTVTQVSALDPSDQRQLALAYVPTTGPLKGYLQTLTDPMGEPFTFQPDPAGRVTQLTLPDTSVIKYGYDANGNLQSVTPPGRPAHSYLYNAVNLIHTYTPPIAPNTGTLSTIYDYNLDRELKLITRPDGKTITPGYDSSGRLRTLSIGRGVYTNLYDSITGQLTSITAPDGGAVAYLYNGALPRTTTWTGNVSGSVTRTYDNDFRSKSLSVDGTSAISFNYDSDSLLTNAGHLTLSPDPQRGGLLGKTQIGNVTDSFGYNGFGELATSTSLFNATPLLSEQYSSITKPRDKLGRIVERVETVVGVGSIPGGTTTFDYTYDTAGRLSTVTTVTQTGTTAAKYLYDGNGNRTSVTQNGVTIVPVSDDQDRLTQYGSNNYTYTANGELLSKTVGAGSPSQYTYDELGNLMNVTLPASPTQPAETIDYIIDGQNRRIGKKVNGALVQGFLYQNRLSPIAELGPSNQLVSQFVYGSRVNTPDYMIKNGAEFRIITDDLGSPRLVIDVATGFVAQRVDYDEFGKVITDSSPGFQPLVRWWFV